MKAIAAAVGANVTFQKHGDYTLAASEVFALLNEFVAGQGEGREIKQIELTDTPFGPSGKPLPLTSPVTTDWSQFTRTAADVADQLKRHGRVPTSVWLGSVPVPPESYLVALARVTRDLADGKKPPKEVELQPAKLAAATYVADDSPELWRWVISPRGFRAPALMEMARRQAWTLKPAVRGELGE